MQYIVHVHNEHSNSPNASDSWFFGPFTLEEARAKLASHVANMNDQLYRISTHNSKIGNDYAGFDWELLQEAGRDEDLGSEVWAEIVALES
jgi:hypothetical protein